MAYLVKIDAFEGPLDLLLHLISKAKVQIEDVSIAEITSQYLEYLEEMKRFDIEIASEFLVMASTLIHIKSCCLLPKVKSDVDDEEEDPREELIAKLLEYKKYKKASEYLKKMETLYSGTFVKLPEEFVIDDSKDNPLEDISPQQLYEAFLKVLASKKESKEFTTQTIVKDTVNLPQRIAELKSFIHKVKETTFTRLFYDSYSRMDIVVTFLALLEMLKDNYVVVSQKKLFDDILIRRRHIHG